MNRPQEALAQRGRPRPVSWNGGEKGLTAAWSLFLKPHYQFERWTVVVGIPESMAFAAIHAIDDTAERIGSQFGQLDTPSRLDRALQLAEDFEAATAAAGDRPYRCPDWRRWVGAVLTRSRVGHWTALGPGKR